MSVGRPPRKNYQALTVRLDKEIYDKLAEYCMVSGQSKTVAVQRAIDSYVDRYYVDQEKLQQLRNEGAI